MKNKIIIVGKKARLLTLTELSQVHHALDQDFEIILLTNAVIDDEKREEYQKNGINTIISARISDDTVLQEILDPIVDDISAILCFSEVYLPFVHKIYSLYPQLQNTSLQSLELSYNKVKMKQAFLNYDANITSKSVAYDVNNKNIVSEIDQQLIFPVVVKPSGLFSSLLVTKCNNVEELAQIIEKIRKKYAEIVHDKNIISAQDIIVEEFVEGPMYSIDVYVDGEQKLYECPLVRVYTGYDIGIEDFSNVMRITPISEGEVSENDRLELSGVMLQGIKALGLKNTSAHIEVIKSKNGWKLIEIGARIGGFRTKIYKSAFGINHVLNDYFIKIGKKPVIPRHIKKHIVALRLYAQNEGVITDFSCLEIIEKLASYSYHKQLLEVGEQAYYAKNGGTGYMNVVLEHESRKQLFVDIERIKSQVSCEVS